MPGISRFKQVAAEVKYNVTTDFPHLGLHAAAATGNLGLVKYALSHGQPINSVLHGVLPLHAACSSGDELVVNLLIENGADVNAPRLPLRYTSDKNRDTSAPIVGTSGSTPLHFACANGHANIVLILLQHGAHPDRADKHGITPEGLARESGHNVCAETIRRWDAEKDQDLRNRAEYTYNPPAEDPSSLEDQRRACSNDGPKKHHLVVKRSIEHAFNLFKISASSGLTPLRLTPPASVSPPDSPSPSPVSGQGEYAFPLEASEEIFPPRRPSLPHIYDSPPQPKSIPSSSSGRPSSAGTGADTQAQQRCLGAGHTGSKYSLRNIFRKYNGEVPSASGTDSPSQLQHSISSSPPAGKRLPVPSSYESQSSSFSPRSRLSSEGGLDSRPNGLSAVELHHQLSSENVTTSVGSEPVPDPSSPNSSQATRPGILRAHNRSSSGQRSTSRALRFDASSTNSSSPRRTDQSLGLKGSSSITSLRSDGISGISASISEPTVEQGTSESAPPTIPTFLDVDDADLGEVVEGTLRPYGGTNCIHESTPECREHEDSFDYSPSLSPEVASNTTVTNDFPFSINNPPPMDDSESKLSSQTESPETRLRGNSVSSTYTDNSVDNPQLSSSGTTSGSASVNLITPAMYSSPLPTARVSSLSPVPRDLSYDSIDAVGDAKCKEADVVDSTPHSGRRSNVPVDIDINAISSHAQAEALVQRAQKSILEMDDEFYSPTSPTSFSSGRSPLSAKLAAYGESLALERRLKREEAAKAARFPTSTGDRKPDVPSSLTAPSHRNQDNTDGIAHKGLDRKFSLEEKRTGQRKAPRKARRPHTADSTSDGRYSLQTIQQHTSHHPLRVHVDPDSPNRKRELTSATESLEIVEISPTPISTPLGSQSDLTSPQTSLYSGSTIEYPSRSRTPDPPSEMYDSFQTVQGVPLSRVSTAPVEATFNDLSPRKTQREHSRQMSRTNKLAKMGFSPSESMPGSSTTTRNIASKTRFGGLRSLVHSLKGKGSL